MSYSIENTVFDVQFMYVNNRGAAPVHMDLCYSLSVTCKQELYQLQLLFSVSNMYTRAIPAIIKFSTL